MPASCAKLLAVCVSCIAGAALGAAAQERLEIPAAMHGFMDAWVDGNEDAVLSYFSTSDQAAELADHVMPVVLASSRPALAAQEGEVGPGYWRIMNDVWRTPRARSVVVDQGPMEDWMVETFAEEYLTPAVVSEDRMFVTFVANRATLVTFTDGTTAEILLTGNVTLGMLVATPSQENVHNPGPFAAFWQQEDDGWFIQTIGIVQH